MKSISAPKYLRIVPEYASKTIHFLRKIYRYKGERVTLDFSDVIEMTEGDFVVVMAQTEKAHYDNGTFFYISTRNIKNPIKKIIEKHLSENNQQGEARLLHFHKAATTRDITMAQNINPIVMGSALADLKKIGITEDFEPLGELLIELLGNATEHGIKNKKINWWLFSAKNHNTKCMDFVFVDMGIGIIGSHKDAGLPILYYLKKKFHVIKDAMNGDLESSTRKPGRGRGMQDIKRYVENGFLSNFILVTNNVAVEHKDDKFVYYSVPNFVGTFFSWSVSKINFDIWKNIK